MSQYTLYRGAAAASSSSSSLHRPSAVASSLALTTQRGIADALSCGPATPRFIPPIELLTASILDPLTNLNMKTMPGLSYFRPVPTEDSLLCDSDGLRLALHPRTYPNCVPPNASVSLKLLGVLEREGLGKVDRTSGQEIVLYRKVHEQFQQLQQALDGTQEHEEDEQKTSALHAASVRGSRKHNNTEEEMSTSRHGFVEPQSHQSHSMFPISVTLSLKNNGDHLISRLQEDGNKNTVWPSALKFYIPFRLFRDHPFEHYGQKVLGDTKDPHFDIGLFGSCNNGLSVLLLALAKEPEAKKKSHRAAESSSSSAAAASSSSDDSPSNISKLKKLLCHYITLVALQYWTIVQRRWVELDPKSVAEASHYLPECMFFFHHSTDFTQSFKDEKRPRKGKSKKKKKKAHDLDGETSDDPDVEDVYEDTTPLVVIRDQQQLQLASAGDAFVPFLRSVCEYVRHRMDALATQENDAISAACRKLITALDASAVKKHCNTIATNHTQFFTCSRMKLHPVANLVKVINDAVYGDNVNQSVGCLLTKFFPCNKDQLKMSIPKTTSETETAGNNRYNNPYFWSHLTFKPTCGVIVMESTLKVGPHPETEAINQACALRRLLFAVNSGDSTLIVGQLFPRLGDCTIQTSDSEEQVTLSSIEFAEQFVQTKKLAGISSMHAIRLAQRLSLPAVVDPVSLRYCVQLDDEIGHPFIPSIARDHPSFPSSDEFDVLSMPRSHFLARALSKKVITGEAALTVMGVLSKNPGELCTRFASSRQTHSVFPVLKKLGGLSHHFTKLFPDDPLCDLVFVDSVFRLTGDERSQLQFIAKNVGEFRPVHMWKLLLKIAPADAVPSYLHYAYRGMWRVKKEESMDDLGAPVVPDVLPVDWILDQLDILKREWEKAQQASVRAFRTTWGETLTPAVRSLKRKSHTQTAASEQRPGVNSYWPVQEAFLAGLRRDWDYCERPNITQDALSALIEGMLAVDIPQFRWTLHTAGALEGVELDVKALITSAVVSQMRRTDGRTPNLLTSLVSESGEPPRAAYAEHVIEFKGTEDSLLGRKFTEFFPLSARNKERRYGTASCNIEVAFFMWYYSTCVIQPLIDNLPRLFPVSSMIKQDIKPGVQAQQWTQTLTPSDATPYLTRQMYRLSADFCKPEIQRELETASLRQANISSKAEAMLMAMQMIIRVNQDSVGTTRTEESRLLQVQKLSTRLLNNRHRQPGDAAIVPAADPMNYFSSRRWTIEDTAVKVIVQQLKLRSSIPGTIINQLYNDISMLIDVQEDAMVSITRVLHKVHNALRGHAVLQPLVPCFTECLRGWAASRPVPDILLRNAAAKFSAAANLRLS